MRYEWGPKGLLYADGREVARVSRRWGRARAEVHVGPWLWRYTRHRREYLGTRDPAGDTTYRARQRSLFSFTWDLTDGTHRTEVRPHGLSHRLDVDRDGRPVGRIGSARRFGVFRPSFEVDADVPLEEVLFVMWVADVIRNRSGGE